MMIEALGNIWGMAILSISKIMLEKIIGILQIFPGMISQQFLGNTILA